MYYVCMQNINFTYFRLKILTHQTDYFSKKMFESVDVKKMFDSVDVKIMFDSVDVKKVMLRI